MVNVNLYLPDELGQQAKAEDLKLSRLLRQSVERELERRRVMRELVDTPQVYEVEICGDDSVGQDGAYTGRITGRLVHETPIWMVYLTVDGRVIIHYGGPDAEAMYENQAGSYYVLEAGAPERNLSEFLREHVEVDFEFVRACRALAVRPVVDL
jgi:hypothetical protein